MDSLIRLINYRNEVWLNQNDLVRAFLEMGIGQSEDIRKLVDQLVLCIRTIKQE